MTKKKAVKKKSTKSKKRKVKAIESVEVVREKTLSDFTTEEIQKELCKRIKDRQEEIQEKIDELESEKEELENLEFRVNYQDLEGDL